MGLPRGYHILMGALLRPIVGGDPQSPASLADKNSALRAQAYKSYASNISNELADLELVSQRGSEASFQDTSGSCVAGPTHPQRGSCGVQTSWSTDTFSE